jgi:hypothetical protein
MSESYSHWSDVRAKGHAVDPRTPAEQAVGKAIPRERQEAYIRGQLDVIASVGGQTWRLARQ